MVLSISVGGEPTPLLGRSLNLIRREILMKVRHLAVLVALAALTVAGGALSAQAGTTVITLNGDSAEISGAGAVADGSLVTISQSGDYRLTGTLDDGQILVNVTDGGAVTLILNGVSLNSSTSAPIYVKDAGSLRLMIAEGSENTVSDAAEYVYADGEDEPNAAIFSDVDTVIEGSGSLTVNANFNDGITSKDTLTIQGEPVITVNAVDDAIRGKDELSISGGTYVLNATEGDGLKADNEDADSGNLTVSGGTFTITAGDDGVQATTTAAIQDGSLTITAAGDGIHADWNLNIDGGVIDILNSEEGLEAGFITINGGTIHIVATDDGINVSEPDDIPNPGLYMLTINGGWVVVNAGGDGLDSNGSITMTGGTVLVNGPTANMDGAIDYDGAFNISGGLLVAAGSAGMPAAPGQSSPQNSVLVVFDALQPAGTIVSIVNAEGEAVITFAPAKDFQSLVVSAAGLVTGETYTIYTGGSHSGAATDGLYSDGVYTPGTATATFTIESAVTTVGNVRMGRGGQGGQPPAAPGGQG